MSVFPNYHPAALSDILYYVFKQNMFVKKKTFLKFLLALNFAQVFLRVKL